MLITSLTGVLIGAGLTFVSQWISQRAQAHRHTSTIFEARRTERLNHLLVFIECAQEAERIAIYRHHRDKNGEEWDTRTDRVLDELWTRVRAVQILCPDDLGAAARKLAGAIDWVMRQGPGESEVEVFLRRDRRALLDASKQHLRSHLRDEEAQSHRPTGERAASALRAA